MPICWNCFWGWPKPVYEIYKKALDKLDGDESLLHFGPAHIVWEDENFDSAEWCLENFEQYRGDYCDSDLEIVRESLIELSKIPVDQRDYEPEDYDGKNPANYPPPENIEFIKC
jgi:hypothetical protein